MRTSYSNDSFVRSSVCRSGCHSHVSTSVTKWAEDTRMNKRIGRWVSWFRIYRQTCDRNYSSAIFGVSVSRSKLRRSQLSFRHIGTMSRFIFYTRMWFRSRRLGLETVSRRTNYSSVWSRQKITTFRSRLGLGYLRLVPKTLFSTKLCKPH